VDWTSPFTITHPCKPLNPAINRGATRAGVKHPLIDSRGVYTLRHRRPPI
jgi:hypothetical protein